MADSERRYRFGPLERRGVVLGMRADQIAAVAVGLVLAVLVLRRAPTVPGVMACGMVIAASAGAAFWPVAGRTPVEWLPAALSHAARVARGRHRFLSDVPLVGHPSLGEPAPHPPAALAGVRLLEAPLGEDSFGVARDREGGYTAVLALRGRSFALLDRMEKERRLEGWANVLSGLARTGSPIGRLQWIERAAPDDQDALGRYLQDALFLPLSSPSVRSYLDLVDSAAPVTRQHEIFLAVRLDPRRASRAVKRAGGGDRGASEVLLRELRALEQQLRAAEVVVDGALSPRMLARAIRLAFDPASRAALTLIAATDPERQGAAPANTWPLATHDTWAAYRSDGAWHATYWVAEWPRVDVACDWMAPLLLHAQATRTVAVVMAPVDPVRSVREVESARTQELADEELRRRAGFLSSARRRRQQDGVAHREEELASGHTEYRFAGYVTVTAATPEDLEAACGEVEQSAQLSRLELRRLYGEQEQAFTYTLPLCRGLR